MSGLPPCDGRIVAAEHEAQMRFGGPCRAGGKSRADMVKRVTAEQGGGIALQGLGHAVPFRPTMSKRTPFYDFHKQAGGKMVDFVGWEMPLHYRSIVEEHEHTRASGSIFDVSHMGRLHFKGKDALAFLEKVCTRGLADAKVGQSRYSLICNETGGVLDDVIVSRDSKHWLVVCNASNREKLSHWFHQVRQIGRAS